MWPVYQVVKVSNHGWHVSSSSPVPQKTRRVGQPCTLNLSRTEMSSRWCGVVVRRGWCQLKCRPRHLTMLQNYEPDGHGYELVSSVRALVPQKCSVEEELLHVKHVEVKSPHVGVMWKFGMGVISSGIVLVN
ncbi:uncharacterized protein TNCV_44331 [Trichonephila clavipes]|nr:uncharacterized protein TNCV_44331 [Trichonephila clavipes]